MQPLTFCAMCLLYLACVDWFIWTIFCFLVSFSIFLVLEFVLYLVKGIIKKDIKYGTTEKQCLEPRKMDLLLMVRVPLQCVFPLFQNNSTSSLYGTTQGFGNHRWHIEVHDLDVKTTLLHRSWWDLNPQSLASMASALSIRPHNQINIFFFILC